MAPPFSKVEEKIELLFLSFLGFINNTINFVKRVFKPNYSSKMSISECSICLEQIGSKNVVTTICGHEFHHMCLCQYTVTSKSTKCPLCRENFAKELVPNTRRPLERNRQANAERERPAENAVHIQRFAGYPDQVRVLPRPNNVRRETVFSRTMTYFESQEQMAIQENSYNNLVQQEQEQEQNDDDDDVFPLIYIGRLNDNTPVLRETNVRRFRLNDEYNTPVLRETNGQRMFSTDTRQEIGYFHANNTPVFFPIR